MLKEEMKTQGEDIEPGEAAAYPPSQHGDILHGKESNYDPVFGEGGESSPNYRSVRAQLFCRPHLVSNIMAARLPRNNRFDDEGPNWPRRPLYSLYLPFGRYDTRRPAHMCSRGHCNMDKLHGWGI
jgi:hypothetical protein